MDNASLPLLGYKVLDLSRVLAGPYCGTLLSMLGADVIKLEDAGGDESRTWPPSDQGVGSAYLGMNMNKRGMVVNLKEAEGQQVVKDLVADCDVLIENFKTGTMERFGLGYEEIKKINPRLVYTSISAFGRVGEKAQDPGYEALVQAYSGIIDITGHPDAEPARTGVSFLDMSSGITSALATMSALLRRERTGEGGRVDASLLQTAMGLMTSQVSSYFQGGEVPKRLGTAHPMIATYQAYPTADGNIFIASANQNLWERLCQVLKREDMLADPRYQDNVSRVNNRKACLTELYKEIGAWKTDDLYQALKKAGVPVSRVNTLKDMLEDPQAESIGAVAHLQDEELGEIRVANLPFHMEGQPGQVTRRAPRLGEHTREILAQAGYDSKRIDDLMSRGVVAGE